MRQNKEHKLVPEDAELFNAMRGNYFSKNERVFFERLQDKEEYEFTVSNDLLLYEGDNEEHIYIVRCEYEEYIVGHGIDGHYDEERHTMCLSDVLRINLKTQGFIKDDITLLQWLRKRDYAGIQYNHNYDDL